MGAPHAADGGGRRRRAEREARGRFTTIAPVSEPEPTTGDENEAETETDGSSRQLSVLQVVAAIAVLGGLGLIVYTLLAGDDDEGAAVVPAVAGDTGGALNTSCFAYRDIDADGRFDVDDRPYAWLVVAGEGPGGTTTVSSNTAGFANFPMRLDDPASLVNEAGVYTFEARPPAGWVLTSGSASQDVEFVEQPDAPVGIVAAGQCEPFGLAPALTVGGSLLPPAGWTGGDVVAAVENESGEVAVETSDGRFVVGVRPGVWTVTLSDGESVAERTVEVGDVPVTVSRFVDDDGEAASGGTDVVVGFDDFTAANTIAEIPNGYGGLDWSNWVAAHRILYGGPGYVNVGTSGEFVAYNGSGHPARVSSDEPFDFVGAYMGVAWPEAEEFDVTVRAWRGDELVHDDTLQLTTSGPVYFDADYRGITDVEIASSARWQVVIDDATFRVAG